VSASLKLLYSNNSLQISTTGMPLVEASLTLSFVFQYQG